MKVEEVNGQSDTVSSTPMGRNANSVLRGNKNKSDLERDVAYTPLAGWKQDNLNLITLKQCD